MFLCLEAMKTMLVSLRFQRCFSIHTCAQGIEFFSSLLSCADGLASPSEKGAAQQLVLRTPPSISVESPMMCQQDSEQLKVALVCICVACYG